MDSAFRQIGLARGIDESEDPGKGTVAEAFNVDTSQGTWRMRPGLNTINLSPGAFSERPRLLAEYIPDYKYEGSHHPAFLIGLGYASTLYEMLRTYTACTEKTGHGQSAAQEYTWVQGLWKFTTGMRSRYTTALLCTNGVDPPFIYHQKTGTGTVEPLAAVEGINPTNITYLTSIPKGRCVVTYKDRTFMGNIGGESGNRIYWTGPDAALAWPMNVWPSNYNMDVGDSNDVSAFKVFREYLVIFKEQSVWVLSGEGVGGAWTIEKISSAHEGALGPRCVCEIEGKLVFFNQHGVYTWGGGAIKTISHPRLEKTWATLNWNKTQTLAASTLTNKCFQCLHEARTHQVYITVGTLANVNDLMLVWNYENDTWDKWGALWDNVWQEGHTTGGAEYALRFTQLGQEIKQLNADGPTVFFASSTAYLHHFDRFQCQDYAVTPDFNIPWKIVTHPYGDNSTIKVANSYKVAAKKTGDWDMVTLLLRDDESIESALRRDVSTYNYIIDSVNNAEHDVSGTSNYTTSAAGPVDVWFVPLMVKRWDSRVLTTATTATKIKFASSLDSSSGTVPMAGALLVLPEDTTPIRTHTMYDSGSPLWHSATLDTAHTVKLEAGSIDFRTNCTGRTFRLLLSNFGCYEGAVYLYSNDNCEPGMGSEITGWEIYYNERGTRRGGG